MVHCCVTGCSNKQDGTRSFFLIPSAAKKKKIRRQWLVNIGRVEHRGLKTGVGKLWSPTKAHVCSDHFTPEAYVRDPRLLASLGFSDFKGLRLKDDAVPTLFPQHPSTSAPKMERPRGAIEKLEQQRILQTRVLQQNQLQNEGGYPEPGFQQLHLHASKVSRSLFTSTDDHTYTSDQEPSKQSTDVQTQTNKSQKLVKQTQTQVRTPTMVSIGTQTDSASAVSTDTQTNPITTKEMSVQCTLIGGVDMDFSDSESSESIDSDDDWEPDDVSISDIDSEHGSEIDDNEIDITDVHEKPEAERKYIVFESNLKELLSTCNHCLGPCRVVLKHSIGSLVSFECSCSNGHQYRWSSQPIHNHMPLGNLLLAGAILFSGNSAVQTLRTFKHLKVPVMTDRTYRLIQANYLQPVIDTAFERHRSEILNSVNERPVKLGGDAWCCSPGHTAKYGSYSIMDLETGLVLDMQLVQVTEVSNSYAMEMEGLRRCLNTLKENHVKVTDLTTDRHCQVRKYMKTNHPDISHWFDVWHMAKGIGKKFTAIGKKKGCEIAGDWSHSISNHLYWAAATSDGYGEMVIEKWISITNHVVNIHEGHGDLYTACEHAELNQEWMLKGSKPHKELIEVVHNARLLKDIAKLSPREQTSQLEAYHKLVCQFAPKFQHFFYGAMKARLLLAVLHNNENASRKQAHKKDGSLRWKISYPKGRNGGHSVKAVKEECSYDYVEQLMVEIVDQRYRYPTYREARSVLTLLAPLPRTSNAQKLDVATAVNNHRSRFRAIPLVSDVTIRKYFCSTVSIIKGMF